MNTTKASLVLVPGMMCDRRLWQPVVELIEPAVDILYADCSKQDSIVSMASEILQRAPARFSLAGLSMGGIVAMEIMRQQPGRVENLAILNSNARAEDQGRRSARLYQARLVSSGRLRELFTDILIPAFMGRNSHIDKEVASVVVEMAEGLGPEVFLRQSHALHLRPDYLGTLGAISCPVLLIGGERDTVCPVSYHQEMARAIGHAKLEILADCGHFSSLEQPERVAALLLELMACNCHNSSVATRKSA